MLFLDYMALLHGQNGVTLLLLSNQVQGSNSGQTMNFTQKNNTSDDIPLPVASTSEVSHAQTTDTITKNENLIEIQKHKASSPS